MLQELSIQNLAVISEAEIPLAQGLNVFTGETGAGKSILIHGIQAVLGQRVYKDIVRTGCKKASITARFSPVSEETRELLAENGIVCEDDELFLTREISADGGSTGRLNGKAVPVSLLRDLGETLVNIHGQHDNQILLRPERHLDVLDRFGEDDSLLCAYREQFAALQNTARELGALQRSEQQKMSRLRELQTIISEIGELDPQPQEDVQLEAQYRAATTAQASGEQADQICDLLTDGEENISDSLANACVQLSEMARNLPEVQGLSDRLKAVNIELRDIADELAVYGGSGLSPAEFQRLSDRRNAVNTIALKYHTDADGLRELFEQSAKEVESIENSSEHIRMLTEKKQQLLHKVTELARKLTAHRKELAEQFSSRVGEELAFLDMPRVQLVVDLTQGKLTPNGMDKAEFLISANVGEPPKPIAQIASGGELSRMMLALKAVIAKRDAIPTLIFDEIDTGVSGRAAQKIGKKLRELGSHHQVLCVTHLSQLAVQAQHHLLIEKHSDETSTKTQVSVLDEQGRIAEIARIMGGADPSELMLQTAAEALKECQ
ncbi:MAG: DNA repair protein RecN [Oscillospiraceae bacterium]|nr:DNA repair protein RecN [Oscillospiraceae bacterium]